ncbi:MAG TPA: N-acetyltransferase [bacterium]|nr:N-acetyltransferase [bacterium]
MEVIIRTARESEYAQTEHITREAFWNQYKPGCEEHLILHNLRQSESYVPALDLVATRQSDIIGHCISTKASVLDPHQHTHEVVCVGPVSVLPAFQQQGVGAQLLQQSIITACASGFAGMILFGDPAYYHRFGFQNAAHYGITTKEGENFDAFMALELQENGLRAIHGRFYTDPAFEVDATELAAFETRFPARVKRAPRRPIG